MAERPNLRVVGGSCPLPMRPGLAREMDLRLRAISHELTKFIKSAEVDLDDEDLATELVSAVAGVQKARLALARRRT